MNKKKILSLLSVFLLTGSILTVTPPAYAADGWFGNGNLFSRLVDFISQKFGLDKTQVRNAVQEFRTQEKTNITPRPTPNLDQWKTFEKQRLDKLVSENKITADQENAILTELAAVRAKYPVNQNDTVDQRKTRITDIRNELKSWATANNINPQYVTTFGFGGPARRGFGDREGRFDHDWNGKVTPTPTPAE